MVKAKKKCLLYDQIWDADNIAFRSFLKVLIKFKYGILSSKVELPGLCYDFFNVETNEAHLRLEL